MSGNVVGYHWMLFMFRPAVCASLLAYEVEVYVVLHEKLIAEKAEPTCLIIKKFIRYVKARPLKFSVYKVIPLDVSLLGMLLSFCITYLIVAIQFTHLY